MRSEWKSDAKRCRRTIEKALRYPLFVKPANLGSSVGISKVHDRSELAAAMDLAATFDRKLVVEQGVGGPGVKPRELEVAVLGNDTPEASVVGEIVPAKEFYDYEAKYQLSGADESRAIIPAKLTAAQSRQIRAMAIAAFRACDCSGLARVDFLMAPASRKHKQPPIFLNEINTMPGFTSISMYPEAMAGVRRALQAADRSFDRPRPGASRGEDGDGRSNWAEGEPGEVRPGRLCGGTSARGSQKS